MICHPERSEGSRVRIGRVLCIVCILCFSACTSSEIFEPIGANMASPLTVAVDSATNRAYIVNSNNKILFTSGSMHIVNLATINKPTLVTSTPITSFSGQIFHDATNSNVFITNRQSDTSDDIVDALLQINVAEAGANFLNVSSVTTGSDPFGIGFDASVNPVSTIVVPTREGTLDVYTINGSNLSLVKRIDLRETLSDGSVLTSVEAIEAVILGTQIVVTRANGGLLVLNTTELTTGNSSPIDFFISDLASPRGLATDGTLVYVVDAEVNGGVTSNVVRVLDLSTLTTDTTNTSITIKSKDTDSLLQSTFTVGDDPQEIVVDGAMLYVSNLDSDTVSAVNITNGNVTNVAVGEEPFGMALYQATPGINTHLLVCNQESNTVSIIELATNSVIGQYP